MKRPPGLWLLLSAGVLWVSLQDVYGIRATSLIFGKTTTTTTTTEAKDLPPEENVTEASTETNSNVTKPTLTGIPQVDYIHDPNLPKELNGYNLSEYPFYERVPDEEFEFKCDGLHDGFYASVPHKCQVYHHCLFGTRYDFLCANYTAFDQKTFICHFVSEVDCVNSKKYWHRNDALYQAATTTTVKPIVVYTPPPQPPPEAVPPIAPRRPVGGRRRPPLRRKRPLYDYYEDYEEEYDYEERPRVEHRRRKRPRPNPRPIYEDEYEDYVDDRYERRGTRRRTNDRRRNKDRRTHEDEDYSEEEVNDRRKSSNNKRTDEEKRYHRRRPSDDINDEVDDKRRERPKHSRPIEEDYEDDLPKTDKSESVEDKPAVKPNSGSSIYDRPRFAPKIKPPVPKNEADKYAYKTVVTTKAPVETRQDDEYYEDYEEEPLPKTKRKPETSESRRYAKPSRREESRETRRKPVATRTRPLREEYIEEEEEELEEVHSRRPSRPKYKTSYRERPRVSSSSKKEPVIDDYYEDYQEESNEKRFNKESTSTTSTTTTTTTTTTTPNPTTTTTTTTTTVKEIPREVVRIVKRPFLPSRGGNPYSSRGLQPVGSKALDKRPETEPQPEVVEEPLFKPSPIIIKIPIRQKVATHHDAEDREEFKPITNRPSMLRQQIFVKPKQELGPRTTQKPKVSKDPLDIDDYDVTLNDALNPTLPNLPVRGYPTGFSPAHDYTFSSFQRPRVIVDPALTQSGSDYVYHQTKPTNEDFVNANQEYKGQYSTISRPRVAHVQLQNYYSHY